MSKYIQDMIDREQRVIVAISGGTTHGVIKGIEDGFLLLEVDNQGPRLLSLAHVEQIIPKQ